MRFYKYFSLHVIFISFFLSGCDSINDKNDLTSTELKIIKEDIELINQQKDLDPIKTIQIQLDDTTKPITIILTYQLNKLTNKLYYENKVGTDKAIDQIKKEDTDAFCLQENNSKQNIFQIMKDKNLPYKIIFKTKEGNTISEYTVSDACQ